MSKLKLVFEDDSHIDECKTKIEDWLLNKLMFGDLKGSIVDVDGCELYLEYSIINDDITVQDIVDNILENFSFVISVERVEDVKS